MPRPGRRCGRWWKARSRISADWGRWAHSRARWPAATKPPFAATSRRSPATTQRCTAASGGRRSSWRRRGGWIPRRPPASRRRSLLIYHPYSGRGRKRELPARHTAVDPDVLQHHRAPLARRFHNIEPADQAVVPTYPDRRLAVRLIARLRHERHHIGLALRERVGADVARRVAIAGVLDELSDQVGAGRAVLRDARAQHLARRGAGRVEPQEAPVGDDAISAGIREPHGEAAGAHLVQAA